MSAELLLKRVTKVIKLLRCDRCQGQLFVDLDPDAGAQLACFQCGGRSGLAPALMSARQLAAQPVSTKYQR